MTGIVEEISLIFLEEVRVRGEVLNIRLGMNLNEIYPPPPKPTSLESDSEMNL